MQLMRPFDFEYVSIPVVSTAVVRAGSLVSLATGNVQPAQSGPGAGKVLGYAAHDAAGADTGQDAPRTVRVALFDRIPVLRAAHAAPVSPGQTVNLNATATAFVNAAGGDFVVVAADEDGFIRAVPRAAGLELF